MFDRPTEDSEVHLALEIANMCEKLNCLPGPGGLLEQDAYHVYMLQCVFNARAQREEKDRVTKQAQGRGR